MAKQYSQKTGGFAAYFPNGVLDKILQLEVKENDNYILDQNTISKIISGIDKFMKEYANDMTTNQLRNIFSIIKKCKSPIDMQLVRPKLAYLGARQQRREAREITGFLDHLITNMKNEKEVKSIKTVAEAMVAYHKGYAKA